MADEPSKTIEEIGQEIHQFLENFPDFDALTATGTLRAVGGGWYEADRGGLPEGMGKYMSDVRMRGGKAQYKPMKLSKGLKALKDSL